MAIRDDNKKDVTFFDLFDPSEPRSDRELIESRYSRDVPLFLYLYKMYIFRTLIPIRVINMFHVCFSMWGFGYSYLPPPKILFWRGLAPN